MAQAIVDPEKLRQFASTLKTVDGNIRDQMAGLKASLQDLGESWRDQQRESFGQCFEETLQALERFHESSDEHIAFLHRKAEEVERYLGSR